MSPSSGAQGAFCRAFPAFLRCGRRVDTIAPFELADLRITSPTLPAMTNSKRSGTPTPRDPQRRVAANLPPAAAAPAPLAARRPMARATRIALFEREVRERPSRAALDLLFARAQVISEGQRTLRGGRDAFFGSTMLTFDLPTLGELLRESCDAGTALRLAALLETDATVERRVRELAGREAARVSGAAPRDVSTHVAIRAQGAKVFIDVDVEAVF
jgi:hypothetical protein